MPPIKPRKRPMKAVKSTPFFRSFAVKTLLQVFLRIFLADAIFVLLMILDNFFLITTEIIMITACVLVFHLTLLCKLFLLYCKVYSFSYV